ncbi:MAG: outer membrane lipoprotein carrier protein LolA [Syntrophales bacterium]|nr:outer membrane lipoprotein carrier protein LolA [Syntrophales bacterium]MCK9528412.1 outer membrane lipoprotein carrier protein LolA [Syntrophales bacterium]MDX9922435.1 outer membrane lipoprotein carrier protein LolA [Syntrophales bacterium]
MIARLLASMLAAMLIHASPGQAAASPEDLDLGEVVAKVQDRYDGIEDIQAAFVHCIPVDLTGTTIVEKGMFYFRKPVNLRWEYSDPPGKLMVIDPEVLWFYLPEENMLYRQKTRSALESQPAARFLTGLQHMDRDFHVSLADPSRDSEGNYLLELKPRGPSAGFESLVLSIDGGTFLLSGYTLTDMYGTTNRYSFTNLSINGGLPDGLFHFDPPPGVPVETLQ